MKTVAFALLALFVLTATASADDRPGPTGSGVQIRVPTGWKTSEVARNGEAFVISLSPDEEASVMYAVAEAENLQSAVKSLDAFLGKFVTGVKMPKVKKFKLNGMPALGAKGTGKVKNGDVQIGVVIAQTPTGKALFVIGLVNASKKAAYKKTLEEVLAGVRPAS
jgi:predicted Zn-dependent protease